MKAKDFSNFAKACKQARRHGKTTSSVERNDKIAKVVLYSLGYLCYAILVLSILEYLVTEVIK